MSLILEISADKTQLTHIDERGQKNSKSIDLTDFLSMMSAHVHHDFGLLPTGCRYLSIKGNTVVVALEVPTQTIDVNYLTTKIPNVSLPPALFIFCLVRGADGTYQITRSSVYAMRNETVILSTDALYHYPTPNVYDEGKVCWGTNEVSKGLKSFGALGGVARRFFSAPFNNDLFRASNLGPDFPWGEISNGEHMVPNYFKYLAEHPFKREWLKPFAFENQNTFTKAIKAFQDGVTV